MTCGQLYRALRAELERVLPEEGGLEATLLCERAGGFSRTELLLDRLEVTPALECRLRELAGRRLQGEPLQYLLGEWEFYGRTFSVGPGVLIPRADTEILLETGLELAADRPGLRVMDLCAGSGCLAVSLALELNAPEQVLAVEKSVSALSYLRENARRNQAVLEIREDDVLSPSGDYPLCSLILSNPPYIPKGEIPGLQQEVQQEPQMALDGGSDGLDFYRRMTPAWSRKLEPDGWLAYEIGQGQEESVGAFLEAAGLVEIGFRKDLGGVIRVVFGRKPL